MNNIAVNKLKSGLKGIDPVIYMYLDEGFAKLKYNLNKERKGYFFSINIDKLKILKLEVEELGLDKSSPYAKYLDDSIEFIENAVAEYENYDRNLEIKEIKEKIRKDKMSFFKKAVMFDGEQRRRVLNKIEEKDKELDFSYEYIVEDILTTLWDAGFEEKIENVFVESKIEDLSYFDFNQYNNSPIESKITQVYY
tara:strand:- start:1547 stop:2131 length:585 start_codon:yes stop_codon:yes gene_type:complete